MNIDCVVNRDPLSGRFLMLSVWILCMLSVPASHGAVLPADCKIDQAPCRTIVAGREILLDIEPKPVKAMQELTFIVHIVGREPAPALLLDLSMPGMYMGRNEVVLKKRPDGKYSGKGIIPRCPSGKKVWQAEVDVPGAAKAVFRFHVSY
jgi:hypothetical protein